MKTTYKGCEIEVIREYDVLFYNVFDDGFEVISGFSQSSDTVRDFIKGLKNTVDDYREHPNDYFEYLY